MLCGTAAPGATEPAFVRACGADLVLGPCAPGARPFRFVGAQASILHGSGERASADAVLEGAARRGLGVLRIWALGEGAADAPAFERDTILFRAGPDGWIDAAFAHLDTVVRTARRLGLRLVVVLANSWDAYGGVPMYLRWAGLPADVYDAEEAFYRDERCRAFYRAHLERIVGRTNAATGVRYRDDPTILAWELINEGHVEPAGFAARRAWAAEMAAAVRAIDPNHLVALGHRGYRTARERDGWILDHEIPGIDYVDAHVYPEEEATVTTRELLSDYVDDRSQLARFVVQKPVVWGEFSFGDPAWLGLPRAEAIRAFAERAFHDGAAGVMLWTLDPSRPNARYRFGPEAPGDADVLDALAEIARKKDVWASEPNPILGPTVGRAFLFPRFVTIARPNVALAANPGAAAPTVAISVPVDRFSRARWERLGYYDGATPAHAYGAESGYFEYAFALPIGGPARIRLRARVSSEFPGFRSPPDGASRVDVSIDGVSIAAWTAPPDDGHGVWLEAESASPDLLAALAAGGVHAVRFTVADDPAAHGLCLYDGPIALRVDYAR